MKTCLAKDPDDGWQSASDLTRELKWIVETGAQAAASTAGAPAAGRGSRERVIAWTLSALFAAATIALGIPYLRRVSAIDASSIRFAIAPPQNVTLNGGNGQSYYAPDGRLIE